MATLSEREIDRPHSLGSIGILHNSSAQSKTWELRRRVLKRGCREGARKVKYLSVVGRWRGEVILNDLCSSDQLDGIIGKPI